MGLGGLIPKDRGPTRPTASSPTARPTDELTTKVVAKWKGWRKPTGPHRGGSCKYFGQGERPYEVANDPRSDTDTALELLWDIMDKHGGAGEHIFDNHNCWYVDLHCVYPGVELPISGPGFRYSVVNLAAQVWGVE